MACRGSGVRVSLAPFFKSPPLQGTLVSRKAPFFVHGNGLRANRGPDRRLFYGRQATPAFSRLSPAFCGVSPIPMRRPGDGLDRHFCLHRPGFRTKSAFNAPGACSGPRAVSALLSRLRSRCGEASCARFHPCWRHFRYESNARSQFTEPRS